MEPREKSPTQLLQEIVALRARVATLEAEQAAQERAGATDRLYRAMADRSSALLCVHDFDGNVLYVNPAATQALGYPPDAWIGRNIRDFLIPMFQPMFEAYLQRIRQHSEDEGFMRVVTKSGETRIWRYHNVWYEEGKRPRYVIGCAQDVTEQVRLERALRKATDQLEQRVQERTTELVRTNAALQESEERYRGLFENAGDILATFTPDGILTNVNRMAETLLGWPPNEVIGQHFRKFALPAYIEHIEERLRRFLAGEKVSSTFELECWRKDGGRIVLEMRNRPMYTKEGVLREFQVIFRNITERKRAEEQLRLAKDRAEAADRLKSELLAIMNHEVRTPLGVIIGYVDLLLDSAFGVLSPEQTSIIRRAGQNARSLLDLINNVLDLSRLEAGSLAIDAEELSLAHVLSETKAETQDICELSGLEFIWEIDERCPLFVSDAEKLKIVIKNLIINAIKFTEKGSVTIQGRHIKDAVEIRVTDTGMGIEPEQQAAMFEAFQQGRSSNVRGLRGVGLGLHIVKRLLDAVGGTIAVTSTAGEGATFTIQLPFRSARAPTEIGG